MANARTPVELENGCKVLVHTGCLCYVCKFEVVVSSSGWSIILMKLINSIDVACAPYLIKKREPVARLKT